MSENLAKIRAIYNIKFPDLAAYSDDRFLRQPIGDGRITDDFCGPSVSREAIEEVATSFGIKIEDVEIARMVTIHSLLDLIDDRTA